MNLKDRRELFIRTPGTPQDAVMRARDFPELVIQVPRKPQDVITILKEPHELNITIQEPSKLQDIADFRRAAMHGRCAQARTRK